MAESKEYSTIVNCEGKLKIALKDDREIALFLRQNGILKKELYDNINEPKSMLSATDKVVKLVTAIRDSVELDSASYHLFVDHMRLNPRVYGTIAGILDKEYNRTSVSLAASINPPSGLATSPGPPPSKGLRQEPDLSDPIEPLLGGGGKGRPLAKEVGLVEGGGKQPVDSDGKKLFDGSSKPGDMDRKQPVERIGAVIILTNGYPNTETNTEETLPATRHDGEDLAEAFNALNFDVYWSHNATKGNLEDYIKKVKELKRETFPKYRCIIFIIAGHGGIDDKKNEYLKMADEKVLKNEELIKKLYPEEFPKDGKHLGGIPKIFLFEACRGTALQPAISQPRYEEGENKKAEEESPFVKIATGGNYFVGEATNKGFMAIDHGQSTDENKRGGWWLHEVYELLKVKRYLYSLEALLTEATRVLMLKINNNRDKYKVLVKEVVEDGFVQPVRTSLLNQNICLDPLCPGGGTIFKQEDGERTIEMFCDHK